jgi:hypothetical protein
MAGTRFGQICPTRTSVTERSWKNVDSFPLTGRAHLHRLLGDREEQEVPEDDDDVARDHDHGEPARHLVHERERDERRQQEELVGRGIQVGAERRLRVHEAGDRAVERVGHARRDEDRERLPVLAIAEEDEERPGSLRSAAT